MCPALETRLLADARKVMGAGKVKLITVCTVQIAAAASRSRPRRRTAPADQPAVDAATKTPSNRAANHADIRHLRRAAFAVA